MMATTNRLGWCDWCEKVVNGVTLNHLFGCPNDDSQRGGLDEPAKPCPHGAPPFTDCALCNAMAIDALPTGHSLQPVSTDYREAFDSHRPIGRA
jgi:hypothetical protein